MGLGCPQVCMDSSEWLQGIVHEEGDSDSLPPSGETITCSRPMTEKRLRPQHDQALKCPRCDSTHTKFCYYNNYSLSQPRYFCKACRRYWTKGGTLRNIPVGGGCRKNKRASAKKPNDQQLSQQPNLASHSAGTNLHLSFPELQLSHLTSILGRSGDLGGSNVMENNYNGMLESHGPIDFVETKFEATLGNSRIHDFMGNNHMGLVDGFGDMNHGFTSSDINSFSSPFGMSLDGNNGAFFDTYNRIMLPFEGNEDLNAMEMKPTNKLLSLDWQDQGCSGIGKDSIGQLNGLGSWTGMMNSYEQQQTH